MPWRRTRAPRLKGSRPGSALAIAAAALLCAGAAPVPTDAPRDSALLIGVGDYPHLSPRLRLAASAGDVERLSAALTGAGLDPDAVTVMTERAGERPTRAAILAALDAAAERARPGDRLLVYFSGHGAQAPARRPHREPDGLEELFLAADARGWNGGEGTVPGAIADFELEGALDRIRARGADVWLVADACHAGGATRSGLAADARVKSVSLAELGAPTAGLRSDARDPTPLRSTTPAAATGSLTAFYAAAPGALAIERRLPPGAPDARPASVFTFALSRALAQGRVRSYRDLFLALEAAAREGGSAAPAPVFDGAMDGRPLGLAASERLFRVTRTGAGLTLEAGAAEGFDPGDMVELVAGPGGPTLGHARVSEAGFARAVLVVDTDAPAGPLYARPVETSQTGGRGERLLRTLTRIAGRDPAPAVAVEARRWRAGCGANPPAARGFPAGAEAVSLLAPPALKHCEVLYLRLTNADAQPLDVSPLYIDATGGIAALSLAPVDDVRLAPGETRFVALRLLTRDRAGRALPTGTERLALVVSAAGRDRADLRSLADAAVLRSGSGGELNADGPAIGALIYPLQVGG